MVGEQVLGPRDESRAFRTSYPCHSLDPSTAEFTSCILRITSIRISGGGRKDSSGDKNLGQLVKGIEVRSVPEKGSEAFKVCPVVRSKASL